MDPIGRLTAATLSRPTWPTIGAWSGLSPRGRELASFAFALGGVVWFVIQAYLLAHKWAIPGGDIQNTDLAAGFAIRDGISPYYPALPYVYAPPWAVAFALLSYLPPPAAYGLIVGLEVAALRFMAGSWRRFGYLLWFPLLPFEILGGAINLIIAASIVAALRGPAWLAIAGILAKLSPAFAVDPRQWRRYVLPVGIAVAITLPWPWLWIAWVQALLTALGGPDLGPYVPVPLAVRIVIALALVATRKPWAIALGAAVATPAFYFGSFVLLIAPIAILWAPKPTNSLVDPAAVRNQESLRISPSARTNVPVRGDTIAR